MYRNPMVKEQQKASQNVYLPKNSMNNGFRNVETQKGTKSDDA